MAKLLGNNVATIIWASLALFCVNLGLSSEDLGVSNVRSFARNNELKIRESIGNEIGALIKKQSKIGSNVLLINAKPSDTGMAYHDVFKSGIKTGFGSGDIYFEEEFIETDRYSTSDPFKIMETLSIPAVQFDELVGKHSDSTIIVSLIGLPNDFRSSSAMVKITNGDLLFYVVGDDVYHIGDLILQKSISAYVVPKRLYDIRMDSVMSSAKEVFDSRFYMITTENIFDITRRDRRLFKIVRKI